QGVHGVVDIGAGTTDVSVFWLQQSRRGAERCTWYSALAIPHGTSLVYRALAKDMAAEPEREPTEGELLRECERRRDVVTHSLELIRKRTHEAWQNGYKHHRVDTTWLRCPLFLCGGGALMPGAHEVFRRAW